MSNAENPVSAPGKTGAAEMPTASNGHIITLNLEEVPTRTTFDHGAVVEIKAFLDNSVLKELPFITNDDFESIEEALDDAGGSGHIVSWKWRAASTYKMLRQYGHEGEPKGSQVKYPAPCLFGDWVVSVRGITAKTWTSERTGNSGVKFEFVGLRPVSVSDYDESIPFEMLEVVDRTEPDADEGND